MQKEIFRLVDQAIVDGSTEEAMRVLNAARERLRRASNASYSAVMNFYRFYGHHLTIDERRWIGHIMAAAREGFVRYEDARQANEMAKGHGLEPFL